MITQENINRISDSRAQDILAWLFEIFYFFCHKFTNYTFTISKRLYQTKLQLMSTLSQKGERNHAGIVRLLLRKMRFLCLLPAAQKRRMPKVQYQNEAP